MEIENIENHLKYVNANGVTLSIDERLNLDLALQKLQLDFGFEELMFWGKINGVSNDYYVAVALQYVGVPDFPKKHYFWCSSANWTFASLPQPLYALKHIFDQVQVFFSGEFDRVVIDPSGKSDLLNVQEAHSGRTKPLEIPPKGVSELDRLAYVIHTVEQDCQVVPLGSLKMTPTKEVRRNEAFRGLNSEQAFQIESYQHFRQVVNREKREQIDRDEGIYNHHFLDEIQTDYPKGAWNIVKDTTQQVALIRSKLWPGYYAYHRVNTYIFGGLYIGNGIKNLDLPFMI
eukprot:403373397